MNKIDALRHEKGLSYQQIASKAGLTPQYISMLAKGERSNPSLATMQKIASALDEKVSVIFQID